MWVHRAIPVLAATLAAASAAAAPPSFVADKIERFDGKAWAGLALGVTTQDGVKKQFRNGRGDYPTSVELQQEGAQGYKVSALFPDKNRNARLDGIAIRYRNDDGDGLPLAELVDALGPGRALYPPRERFEDWKVLAYPQKGILLFVSGDRVPLVLLGYPERVGRAAAALLGDSAPPVTPFVDPHADEPRVVTFNDIDVDFSLSGDLRARDEYGERRGIERQIRAAARPGGVLVYAPGAGGSDSYRVSVTGRYDNKKRSGSGSVSVSISGRSPYGRVSGSGYASFKVEGGDERKQEIEDTGYARAVSEAMRDAEDAVERDLARKGPPPVGSFRRAWWDRVVEQYRFKTRDADADASAPAGGGLL